MIIFLPIIGALLYRIRGGLIKGFPRWLSVLLFTCGFLFAVDNSDTWPFAFILTWAAVATGHGRWQSLKDHMSGEPEKMEFLINWLESRMPTYWYKVMGLDLSGLLISLPMGISSHNAYLALSGLGKPVAYMIGWKLAKNGRACEIGEWLTGAALYGGIALAIA